MPYMSPEQDYPLYMGDIQQSFPKWKAGDALPDGWHEVLDSQLPVPSEEEMIVEGKPIEINGQMYRDFSLQPLSTHIINERNAAKTALEKLQSLGFTDEEITAISAGLI
jgi:hypothetical protein